MTTTAIPNGTAVLIETDLGLEPATVLSHSNALRGEQVRYTVRFADRTQSSWGEARVRRAVIA